MCETRTEIVLIYFLKLKLEVLDRSKKLLNIGKDWKHTILGMKAQCEVGA
jgi:hypothetical protein